MPSTPSDLPRFTVSEMAEDLREDAVNVAEDLIGFAPQDTTAGQAAQTLEEFEAALTWIASGVPDPQAIALDALSLSSPLKPIGEPDEGDADDTIRKLLKPRSR